MKLYIQFNTKSDKKVENRKNDIFIDSVVICCVSIEMRSGKRSRSPCKKHLKRHCLNFKQAVFRTIDQIGNHFFKVFCPSFRIKFYRLRFLISHLPAKLYNEKNNIFSKKRLRMSMLYSLAVFEFSGTQFLK